MTANLGMLAEVALGGGDRPRCGNAIYGAFGRDFESEDGRRVMIVAITQRQWTSLVAAAEIGHHVAVACVGTTALRRMPHRSMIDGFRAKAHRSVIN